ncbi:hypothetical protein PR048_032123 [Dryococelus australis]|uniref:Uncharacterized protein n=1 Tax=Dryococelus australis TaxID=614101 RepID=A0ABQ9G1B1_9NEOP|nr:hypothetical protein PR048_032123 [Dryococelus australis]
MARERANTKGDIGTRIKCRIPTMREALNYHASFSPNRFFYRTLIAPQLAPNAPQLAPNAPQLAPNAPQSAIHTPIHNNPSQSSSAIHDNPSQSSSAIHDNPSQSSSAIHDNPSQSSSAIHDNPSQSSSAIHDNPSQSSSAIHNNPSQSSSAIHNNPSQSSSAIHDNPSQSSSAIHDNPSQSSSAIHDNPSQSSSAIHDNPSQSSSAIHDNPSQSSSAIHDNPSQSSSAIHDNPSQSSSAIHDNTWCLLLTLQYLFEKPTAIWLKCGNQVVFGAEDIGEENGLRHGGGYETTADEVSVAVGLSHCSAPCLCRCRSPFPLLEVSTSLTTTQECSGETGWRLIPPLPRQRLLTYLSGKPVNNGQAVGLSHCSAPCLCPCRSPFPLLEVSTGLATTQECSGETGWRLIPPLPRQRLLTYLSGKPVNNGETGWRLCPPRRISRVGEDSRRRSKTLKAVHERWRPCKVIERVAEMMKISTCNCPEDGNTARLARRSDEALGVRVSVARIAPSLLDLAHPTLKQGQESDRLFCSNRLLHSPPNRTSLVRSSAGSLPDFRTWESCRAMPLVGGFSQGSPISPRPCIPALLHTHRLSRSPMLGADQISPLAKFQLEYRRMYEVIWDGMKCVEEESCTTAVSHAPYKRPEGREDGDHQGSESGSVDLLSSWILDFPLSQSGHAPTILDSAMLVASASPSWISHFGSQVFSLTGDWGLRHVCFDRRLAGDRVVVPTEIYPNRRTKNVGKYGDITRKVQEHTSETYHDAILSATSNPWTGVGIACSVRINPRTSTQCPRSGVFRPTITRGCLDLTNSQATAALSAPFRVPCTGGGGGGSDKVDTATHINCAIASTRKALTQMALILPRVPTGPLAPGYREPMRVSEVSVEQRRNARGGIIRHGSHTLKSEGVTGLQQCPTNNSNQEAPLPVKTQFIRNAPNLDDMLWGPCKFECGAPGAEKQTNEERRSWLGRARRLQKAIANVRGKERTLAIHVVSTRIYTDKYACANRGGRCRWSAGLLGDLPFLPLLHSGAAPFSPQSLSPALKTSLLRDAGISSLIHFTVNDRVATGLENREFSNGKKVATLSEYGAAPECKGTGNHRENPPTSSIVRYDFHMRKSGSRESIPLALVVETPCDIIDAIPQHVLGRAFHSYWCRLHTCLEPIFGMRTRAGWNEGGWLCQQSGLRGRAEPRPQLSLTLVPPYCSPSRRPRYTRLLAPNTCTHTQCSLHVAWPPDASMAIDKSQYSLHDLSDITELGSFPCRITHDQHITCTFATSPHLYLI